MSDQPTNPQNPPSTPQPGSPAPQPQPQPDKPGEGDGQPKQASEGQCA